jgi:conjugative relaxase-like TrwC/TraI family protein
VRVNYSEKDQVIGKWGGKAAVKLGLDENIFKKDFADLCDNINPDTGEKLTSRNDVDRRVGYDLTFNASKSVSLAYSFAREADKKEILQAFQTSVHETMSEVETGMQVRVRDKGKNENRETGNIVYGEFTHFTTRPIDGVPDPHLHSHCFVFNATWDEHDNKFKAGEFGQIKQDAPYYEAVFHSRLAEKLEAIGYKTERTENGFELKGIDKATLDKFSRRTKEIEDYAKEHDITGDKKKSQIGSKTREANGLMSPLNNKRIIGRVDYQKKRFQKLQTLKFPSLIIRIAILINLLRLRYNILWIIILKENLLPVIKRF